MKAKGNTWEIRERESVSQKGKPRIVYELASEKGEVILTDSSGTGELLPTLKLICEEHNALDEAIARILGAMMCLSEARVKQSVWNPKKVTMVLSAEEFDNAKKHLYRALKKAGAEDAYHDLKLLSGKYPFFGI